MAIQVRRGKEDELDISKAVPGEWLVSTDTRYVRMCFAPGIVLRMATYEAFEADTQKFIEQMEQILSETNTVQEAVERIQNEIEDSVITVENYVESAKGYSNLSNTYAMQSKMYAEESNNYADDSYNEAERAKMYAENAEAVTNVKIASQTEAGLMRGGENYVDESGTLVLTKQTTDATLYNSYSGGLKIDRIAGASKQNQYTGKNLFDVSEFKYFDSSTTTIEEINCDTGYIKITFENAASLGGVYTGQILNIIDGKTYIASVNNITNVSGINCIVQALDAETGEWIANYTLGKTFTASSEYMYRFIIQNNTGTKYSGTVEVDSIQLELGSVATDYEPYVGGIPSPNPDYPQEIKNVEVSEISTHNKNIITDCVNDNSYARCVLNRKEPTLAKITRNVDSTQGTSYYLRIFDRSLEYGTYTASCKLTDSGRISIISRSVNETFTSVATSAFDDKETSVTFVIDDKVLNDVNTQLFVRFDMQSINNGDSITFYDMQLEKNRVKTDFVEPESSTALIAFTCRAIEVSADDDYTYEKDGKYYIADTIERVDGGYKYVQRIEVVSSYNGETITNAYMSTTGGLDIGAEVHYILAEPIITQISDEDAIALMSLKTFDTVTYISTDSDIEPVIEVEYGTSRIGGYTLEALNTAQKNEIQYASLATLTNSLATALVAGSEE